MENVARRPDTLVARAETVIPAIDHEGGASRKASRRKQVPTLSQRRNQDGATGNECLFCGDGFFREHFADAFNLRAYIFQLLFYVFVAAVNVVDPVDNRFAIGD